jgi:nitrite reductase/ring-hydroxylating ferredoxin subunit
MSPPGGSAFPPLISIPAAMTRIDSLLDLCATSEVPEGGAIKVEKEGLILAVFNLGGRFFVTDDTCTHGPGSLSEGDIDGEIVECNFHNGAFHIPSGRVEAPPCMVPLRTYAVEVVDGKVCIEQPAGG